MCDRKNHVRLILVWLLMVVDAFGAWLEFKSGPPGGRKALPYRVQRPPLRDGAQSRGVGDFDEMVDALSKGRRYEVVRNRGVGAGFSPALS
ncbi:MAG: hypothetical protein AB2L11_04260 [Syntrophobacteraceae bacterium]